ncbi:MAG: amidase family protein, partial [Ilumatobacteraceae bacterium]
MDAVDQAALVRRGEVSATELLDAAIERIESIDPQLNAVIIRWFDDARRGATQLPDGPFSGVPFLLKDLWAHFAGQPLTNGCRALKNDLPISPADTTLVTRFRQAGLNIAGRTNSPEFGSLPATEPM